MYKITIFGDHLRNLAGDVLGHKATVTSYMFTWKNFRIVHDHTFQLRIITPQL